MQFFLFPFLCFLLHPNILITTFLKEPSKMSANDMGNKINYSMNTEIISTVCNIAFIIAPRYRYYGNS
jgi:hypothetical protein